MNEQRREPTRTCPEEEEAEAEEEEERRRHGLGSMSTTGDSGSSTLIIMPHPGHPKQHQPQQPQQQLFEAVDQIFVRRSTAQSQNQHSRCIHDVMHGFLPVNYSNLSGLYRCPVRVPTSVLEHWTPLDIRIFESAISIYGKHFHRVQRMVGTCLLLFPVIWKHEDPLLMMMMIRS